MSTAVMSAAVSESLSDPVTLLARADAAEEAGDDLLAADYRELARLVSDRAGLGRDLDRVTHVRFLADDLLTEKPFDWPREPGSHYHRCLATARQPHGWFSDGRLALPMLPREKRDMRLRRSPGGKAFPVGDLGRLHPEARLRLIGAERVARVGRLMLLAHLSGSGRPKTFWVRADYYGFLRRRNPDAAFWLAPAPLGPCLCVVEPKAGARVGFVMTVNAP